MVAGWEEAGCADEGVGGCFIPQKWVRMRARQGGFPRPQAVLLVSALKGAGVQELLIRLHREVGPAGDVWVVRHTHPAPHPGCKICKFALPLLPGCRSWC